MGYTIFIDIEWSGSMNVIDVVIILMILMFGVIGLKRGFFKQTVMTIGTVLVFYLAYKLKDPLASWMSSVFPFFHFSGRFAGVSVLNIILYQLIAFIVVLCLLLVVLNILITVTGIVEKILKFTIILGIPSKILGFVLGIIEGFVIVFVVLFFLRQPGVNFELVNESKVAPKMLDHTPVLSRVIRNTNQAIGDIYSVSEKFVGKEDSNQLNIETIDVMLKYKIVKVDYIEKLLDKNKLDNVTGIDTVLNKYR